MEDNTVMNGYGVELNFDAAVQMMDADIREELHGELAPCTEQEFFDAYCSVYEKRFGEPFFLDSPNPQW